MFMSAKDNVFVNATGYNEANCCHYNTWCKKSHKNYKSQTGVLLCKVKVKMHGTKQGQVSGKILAKSIVSKVEVEVKYRTESISLIYEKICFTCRNTH